MLLKYKLLDVIFIQESHATDNDREFWRSMWGGQVKFANAVSNSRGVMILTRKDYACEFNNTIVDPNGRYIATEVSFEDQNIVLCNVYAPNRDSLEFFVNIAEIIEKFQNPNVIMGGDFNFVIDNSIDRKFSHVNNDKARNTFMQFAEHNQLSDVWRILNPEKIKT